MSAAGKSHWLRNTIIVLLVCGIAGTILAAIQFTAHPDRTCAKASLQLSFAGAADGIAPNGYQFDMGAMDSDEVLESALEDSGLQGRYTADQLRENLVVTSSYPDDLVEQVTGYDSLMDFTGNRELLVSSYHPTTFSVALYNDFDKEIAPAQLQELLANVLSSFRARFSRIASVYLDWQDGELYNLEQYDYPQQLEVIQEIIEQQARYAQEMYEKAPTFLKDGKGFNDIYVRFNSLVESDIVRLNANITINALTRDMARLLMQYQFEVRDLSNQLTNQQEQLKRLDALIASYEKNEIIYLNTTNSLTKIDGNSSVTYDALVTARKELSDEITQTNSRIATYQLKLADLMKDSAQKDDAPAAAADDAAAVPETLDVEEIQALTEEEIAAAAEAAEEAAKRQTAALEVRIANLVAMRDAVTADFAAMLQDYTDRNINEHTMRVYKQSYFAPSLLSGAFIKKAIKIAGPICALGFMACMVLLILKRRKEKLV